MTKKALITGIRGQDGAYLAKLLLEKGYRVLGADRRGGDLNLWRLRELGIEHEVRMVYIDLLEPFSILHVIETVQPDEVYNLAAQSFVQASYELPVITAQVNAMGVLYLLEAIRTHQFGSRFFQASSSAMFGRARQVPQDEKTAFYPTSPYSVAKLFGHWITVNYREAYGMFACSGILFNHESPLRGREFVTRKITSTLAEIRYGLRDRLVLGNLDAQRDWGYAPEYVEAMWLMLQADTPDDYVIATGESHSVREFVEKASEVAGFDLVWQGEGVDIRGVDRRSGKVIVEVSPQYFRPSEIEILRGDYSKAKTRLGWSPKTRFEQLVEIMMEADLRRVREQIG
ncbi:MAG: GDP-mannose 4,6-dehydratase [Armatimonadota bacterium]|nr:GDP-mannose 4,6-dehydratase [Armatimonadota bacterium]